MQALNVLPYLGGPCGAVQLPEHHLLLTLEGLTFTILQQVTGTHRNKQLVQESCRQPVSLQHYQPQTHQYQWKHKP